MIEFVLAFIFMLIAVAAMAVGVINGRAPIAGTCGGLNNMGDGGACELCGGDMSKCDSIDEIEKSQAATNAAAKNGDFYEAKL